MPTARLGERGEVAAAQQVRPQRPVDADAMEYPWFGENEPVGSVRIAGVCRVRIIGERADLFPAGLDAWIDGRDHHRPRRQRQLRRGGKPARRVGRAVAKPDAARSEEHTSELQSLMRISYAVFCLKKKTQPTQTTTTKAQ